MRPGSRVARLSLKRLKAKMKRQRESCLNSSNTEWTQFQPQIIGVRPTKKKWKNSKDGEHSLKGRRSSSLYQFRAATKMVSQQGGRKMKICI